MRNGPGARTTHCCRCPEGLQEGQRLLPHHQVCIVCKWVPTSHRGVFNFLVPDFQRVWDLYICTLVDHQRRWHLFLSESWKPSRWSAEISNLRSGPIWCRYKTPPNKPYLGHIVHTYYEILFETNPPQRWICCAMNISPDLNTSAKEEKIIREHMCSWITRNTHLWQQWLYVLININIVHQELRPTLDELGVLLPEVNNATDQ